MSETRYTDIDTAAGQGQKRLLGVVMRYGALALLPDGRQERFMPGAFGPDVGQADIILNSMHVKPFPLARANGGGLRLNDSASMLTMMADLSKTQPGREAHEQVQAGVLRGLSIEFTALQERMVGDVREIVRARLDDLGLVDRPAYEDSTIEARRSEKRARLALRISGVIPYEKRVDCRCQTGRCNSVVMKRGSLKAAVDSQDEILLVAGDYSKALSSKKRGSLILTESKEGLKIESAIPDNSAGRDLVAGASEIPLLVRPSFDQAASEFVEDGATAIYTHMSLRAVLIGASDAAAGWPEAELIEPEERTEPRKQRRRVWL